MAHWDGQKMRVAAYVPTLPRAVESIGALKRVVKRLVRQATKTKGPGALHEVLRVAYGPAERGLFWTHIRSEEAPDAALHFEAMRTQLGLRRTDRRRNAWTKKSERKKVNAPAPPRSA